MTDNTKNETAPKQERAMTDDNVCELHPPAAEHPTFNEFELLEETVPFLTSLDTDLHSDDLPPDATLILCNVEILRQGKPVYRSDDMILAATTQTLPPDDTDLLSARTITLGSLMLPLRFALDEIVSKWKRTNIG